MAYGNCIDRAFSLSTGYRLRYAHAKPAANGDITVTAADVPVC